MTQHAPTRGLLKVRSVLFLTDRARCVELIIFLSYKNLGVFRKGIDGVDVSAVTVHPGGALIAASYRNGDVRVYRYPCQSQQVRHLN